MTLASCSLFPRISTRPEAFPKILYTRMSRRLFKMGQAVTLFEAIKNLSDLDENDTIYVAEPWTENSKAIVAPEPVSGGLPAEAAGLGLKYFLEVSVAREVLEGWTGVLGAEPNLRAKVERLTRYAIDDA